MPSAPASHGSDEPPMDASTPGKLAAQCAELHRRITAFLERAPASERVAQVQRQTRVSLSIIAEALTRYRLDELSFSYNGGKDCLVLLILYLAALHEHTSLRRFAPTSPSATLADLDTTHPLPPLLRSVYIVTPNPFPAVTSFVESSAETYALSLARYEMGMREAFDAYLRDYPSVKAIFVGTRRTDPHGATLTHFDPTTAGWPSFMRIHPVIDWHYAEIWLFIREMAVPYCELYDQGYTSLGGTTDTLPNPALEIREKSEEGAKIRYRPAYELMEDGEERLGRDRP